jgi:hypothetical protein
MKSSSVLKITAAMSLLAVAGIGCQNQSDGFSLFSESNVFKQSAAYAPKPVDVLWVVDNSGSMSSSQTNLANNFRSFIQQFESKGYDFRMAVGTTDAYFRLHYNQDSRARFKDGSGSNRTGIYVMDKNTPDLENVFVKNVRVGTSGSGDERAFESMKQLLLNPLNSDFRRAGAYLAIIIVSDEEDTSHYDWFNGTSSYVFTDNPNHSALFNPATNPIHPTLNPQHGWHPPEMFKNFLDTFTSSSATTRNYVVNSITINDEACRTQLGNSTQKLAPRVKALSELTGGVAFSLCQPFNQVLDAIQQQVLRGAATFQLNREPIVATIVVRVNGQVVPQDPVTGWIYDAATNSVIFADPPPADALITIDFDPATVKI